LRETPQKVWGLGGGGYGGGSSDVGTWGGARRNYGDKSEAQIYISYCLIIHSLSRFPS
jgi:hypothetical protein